MKRFYPAALPPVDDWSGEDAPEAGDLLEACLETARGTGLHRVASVVSSLLTGTAGRGVCVDEELYSAAGRSPPRGSGERCSYYVSVEDGVCMAAGQGEAVFSTYFSDGSWAGLALRLGSGSCSVIVYPGLVRISVPSHACRRLVRDALRDGPLHALVSLVAAEPVCLEQLLKAKQA